MSVVTNVILTCSGLDREIAEKKVSCIGPPDRQPYDRFGPSLNERNPRGTPAVYGGSKALEGRVFVAAFNCLEIEDLIRQVKGVPWTQPQTVRVFVKREDDAAFWTLDCWAIEPLLYAPRESDPGQCYSDEA